MTAILVNRPQTPAESGQLLPKGNRMTHIRPDKHSSRRAIEVAEFRLIFVVSFMAFLLGAIVSRLLPRRRGAATADRTKSIFAQARAATDRTIPFAFMS